MHIAECRLYHYLKTYYGCLKWIDLCTGMVHYSIGGIRCTLHVGLGPGQIIYISYPDANSNQGHTCLVVVKFVKMAILQCPRHVTLSCYTEAISLSLARCTVIYSVISQQFQLGNAVLLEMKHTTIVLQTIGPGLAVWRNGGHKLWAQGHRRRSGWDSGDAWRALKVVWCRVGGVWRGVSLPQPTRGPGERRQLVERGRGRAPAENGFWRILNATGCSFLPIWQNLRGTICVTVPLLQILGARVIYAHAEGYTMCAVRLTPITSVKVMFYPMSVFLSVCLQLNVKLLQLAIRYSWKFYFRCIGRQGKTDYIL